MKTYSHLYCIHLEYSKYAWRMVKHFRFRPVTAIFIRINEKLENLNRALLESNRLSEFQETIYCMYHPSNILHVCLLVYPYIFSFFMNKQLFQMWLHFYLGNIEDNLNTLNNCTLLITSRNIIFIKISRRTS